MRNPRADEALGKLTSRRHAKPGILHLRTPSASPGYWNRLDVSRRAFVGEWFRTGDVMTRDADGFYHHAGRDDELFKVAGMWVAPADVEAALLAHPAVVDAGVVGAPGEDRVGFTAGRRGVALEVRRVRHDRRDARAVRFAQAGPVHLPAG